MADQTVKPTPTQAENDAAASGEHITEHEPDGSPEQPTQAPAASGAGEAAAKKRRAEEETRALKAKEQGGPGYATRASTAAPAKPSAKNE